MKRISFIFTLTLVAVFTSCGKPSLKDFDQNKLKHRYVFDLTYTSDQFNKLRDSGASIDGFENLKMIGLLALKADLFLDKSSGGFMTSTNLVDPTNTASSTFDYRIEDNSIIYIKIDDYDDTTQDEYVKGAVLLEYGKNYEYFIIQPLTGGYENFKFKLVERKFRRRR